MLLKQPEDALILKCQLMLREERQLPKDQRDHEFIKLVLRTIVQLQEQKRSRRDLTTLF
jgi:hypothetical protein